MLLLRLYHAKKNCSCNWESGTRLPEDQRCGGTITAKVHIRQIDLAAKGGGATSPPIPPTPTPPPQNPHCENPLFYNGRQTNIALPKAATAKRIYRNNKQRGRARGSIRARAPLRREGCWGRPHRSSAPAVLDEGQRRIS